MESTSKRPCEQFCPYITDSSRQLEHVAASGDAFGMYVGAGMGLGHMWRTFRARHCEGAVSLTPHPGQSGATYCSLKDLVLVRDGSPAGKSVDKSKEAMDHPYMRDPQRWRELYWQCWERDRENLVGRLAMFDNDGYPAEELSQAQTMSREEIYHAYGRDDNGALVQEPSLLQSQEFEVVMHIKNALDEHSTVTRKMQAGLTYDEAIDTVVDSRVELIQGYATDLLLREQAG